MGIHKAYRFQLHPNGWQARRILSFRIPSSKEFKLDQSNSRILLPKLGWMRYRNSRVVDGALRNLTVSRQCGRWYVSIQVEAESESARSEGESVGLDAGIVRLATLSDGTVYEPIHSFRRQEQRLRRAQQSLSRKVKFSNHWTRQKLRIQKIHAKTADCRRDHLHKCSTEISHPGRRVQSKSGLNKAILDQGWHEFQRQLDYKLSWRGDRLVKVPSVNTSRTCPCCSHVSKGNRRSQAQFRCVACGYEAHADLVAAINIARAGQARIACEVSDAVMSPAAGTRRNDLVLRDAA